MKLKSRAKTEAETEKLKVTTGDPRGVFFNLFPEGEAARLTEMAELLRPIQNHVSANCLPQAKLIRVCGSREIFDDLRRGRLGRFSIEQLRRYAKRLDLCIPQHRTEK